MSGRDIIVIGASSGGIEALNRLVGGLPPDLAAAVSFLCSSNADYITGQTLNVDGGIEMN